MKHWKKLLREAVDFSSLEILKTWEGHEQPDLSWMVGWTG